MPLFFVPIEIDKERLAKLSNNTTEQMGILSRLLDAAVNELLVFLDQAPEEPQKEKRVKGFKISDNINYLEDEKN